MNWKYSLESNTLSSFQTFLRFNIFKKNLSNTTPIFKNPYLIWNSNTVCFNMYYMKPTCGNNFLRKLCRILWNSLEISLMINPEYTLNEIMWFLRVTVTRTCTFLYPDQIFTLLTISKAYQFLQLEILFFIITISFWILTLWKLGHQRSRSFPRWPQWLSCLDDAWNHNLLTRTFWIVVQIQQTRTD